MRIPRASIHPSIWSARGRFIARSMSGEAMSEKETAASSQRQTCWLKRNAGIFVIGLIAFFICLMEVASFKHSMSKPMLATSILALMAVAGGGMALALRGSQKYLDSEELKILLPILELSPVQEAYVEALLTLSELNLDAGAHDELVAGFMSLLDEEARLLSIKERAGLSGGSSTEVLSERNDLRHRIEMTNDSVTREALLRSLEICEARLALSVDSGTLGGRVDAQLEVIAQSMRNYRDTLRRLHSAPVQSNLNMDPIRDTIRQAQQHASALEAAVREVESV